jgi:DNA-binding transcriptional ArsR family regulator
MSSGIGRAIDELLAERQHLVARLAKLDAGIATLRELFHLPAPTTPLNGTKTRLSSAAAAPSANGNGHGHRSELDETILTALRDGPMPPGELAAALKVERAALRHHLKQLEACGLLVSTGVTASRRVALAPGASAKEAPSRD